MSLLDQIAEAGIVGCGGAGFPTHVKLKGKFEYLIVNGAECEPLLQNDRYLMRNKANEIVLTATHMARELNIPHAVIALKAHYKKETDALRAAINRLCAPIELCLMDSFYPAGDEQAIVYEVTGRIVPPGGLPSAVGAVVNNVATIYAIHEALQGRPLIERYVTVTGEVNQPAILQVPIGTPVLRCIELAGGAKIPDYYVVSGGPMMGKPVADVKNAVISKTTSGILVLKKDCRLASANNMSVAHMLNRARSACIQCSFCTQLCPRHMLGHPLRPHLIMRKMAVSTDISMLLNDPDIRNAQLCCECGLCEVYACPMGLQPRRINGMIRQKLAEKGIRYENKDSKPTVNPMREVRKAPTAKVAARAGVYPYESIEIEKLVADKPKIVSLPLKMHAGAPSEPVVSVGQIVSAGTLIAKAQNGKLGSNIHASISGRVAEITDRITIIQK